MECNGFSAPVLPTIRYRPQYAAVTASNCNIPLFLHNSEKAVETDLAALRIFFGGLTAGILGGH
jgi:hypothetical protein